MYAATAAGVCGPTTAITASSAPASSRQYGNQHPRRGKTALGRGHWRTSAASSRAGCHDRYGLHLSTRSAGAARRYVDGVDRVLALQPGAEERLRSAIEADAEFALAHAALALLHHRRGNEPQAKASLERARACLGSAGGVSLRERRHVAAIAAAVDGDARRALRLIRAHLRDFPRDALLLQEAAELITWSGCVRLREERLALLASVAPHYRDDWWFLGDYAFDLAEAGRLDHARRLAERALARNPRHAGAAHSLAHVYYEAGDPAGGAAFLRAWLPGYDRHGAEHSHITWHLALCELGLGHAGRALAVYARDLDPAAAPHRRLVDAASLLWRCRLARPDGGAGAALPWRPVCALAGRGAARPGAAFQAVHAAMAYAGAGDAAALRRLVGGLRVLHAQGDALAGGVTLPLVQALGAFAGGAYAETIGLLEPLVSAGQIARLGGSNAQQSAFGATLAEARRRAGRAPTRTHWAMGRAATSGPVRSGNGGGPRLTQRIDAHRPAHGDAPGAQPQGPESGREVIPGRMTTTAIGPRPCLASAPPAACAAIGGSTSSRGRGGAEGVGDGRHHSHGLALRPGRREGWPIELGAQRREGAGGGGRGAGGRGIAVRLA